MNEELTRMVEPEIIKMGVGQRIIALFTAPSELMRNIKAYPVILVPFLLALVLGLITIVPARQATQLANQELSHIFIERYGAGVDNPFDVASLADEYGESIVSEGFIDAVTMVTLVFSAVFMPFIVSLLAGLGFFILSKIMRGPVKFGQMFSMYMHIYVITALGALVTSLLISLTGSIVDITSLAAVVTPNGRLDEVSYNVFASIAVFPVWATILSFIGVKILNDFSAIKAGIAAGIVYISVVAVNVIAVMSTWWVYDAFMAAEAMQ
ncbi:MAG: YIP1 family protein [Defluviitaleaceae bacterium]|nr:YIP1 family protein [Defluviitaleaceae bacterium]